MNIKSDNHAKLECLQASQFIATERLAASALISQDAVIGLAPDGEIQAWNPAAVSLFGYLAEEAIGKNIAMLAPADRQGEQKDFLDHIIQGNIHGPVESTRLRKDGTMIHIASTAAPVHAMDGSVVGIWASIRDITARKETERHQKSMTRELTHRLKNSFAVLQSIMHSTLKTSPKPEDFARVFSRRLYSLSAAQDALTENDWRGIELGSLVRRQLAAYDKLDNVKLTIQGPEVYLAAHYASPFGLMFNELAANALKHGAWSWATGRVELNWRVESKSDGKSKLCVCWQERGGPKPPTRRPAGLGVVLIEKSLAGAQVVNTYEVQGLTCTIELDINPLKGLDILVL